MRYIVREIVPNEHCAPGLCSLARCLILSVSLHLGQVAKKVMSNSLGLVNCAVWLVGKCFQKIQITEQLQVLKFVVSENDLAS